MFEFTLVSDGQVIYSLAATHIFNTRNSADIVKIVELFQLPYQHHLLTFGDDNVKSKEKWVVLFAISGMYSISSWQMFPCSLFLQNRLVPFQDHPLL